MAQFITFIYLRRSCLNVARHKLLHLTVQHIPHFDWDTLNFHTVCDLSILVKQTHSQCNLIMFAAL